MWRWAESASSMEGLARQLGIKSERISEAFIGVDRGNYVDGSPYMDSVLDTEQRLVHRIWCGVLAMLSCSPAAHYHALERLEPFLQPGNHVLDVGCGSGWLMAAFAKMIGPTGRVIGVDIIPELVEMSERNVKRGNPEVLPMVEFHVADGCQGWLLEAPYAAIHVGAAAKNTPRDLLDQLAAPGRMVIPVGVSGGQEFMQYDKDAQGHVEAKRLFAVNYVPLVNS